MRLEQLGLAVAGDAGDADDLAGAHVEATRPRRMATPRASLTVEVLDLEQLTAPGLAGALLDAQQHAAADHQLGELRRAWSRRSRSVAHHLALAHDRDSSVIAMISRSLWVMRMIVLPWSLQLLEDAEQVVGLGRRQHAGRLVEDQDVGAAVERLQDLDALLQADRESSMTASGSTSSSYSSLEPLQLGARLGERGLQQRARPRRRA